MAAVRHIVRVKQAHGMACTSAMCVHDLGFSIFDLQIFDVSVPAISAWCFMAQLVREQPSYALGRYVHLVI